MASGVLSNSSSVGRRLFSSHNQCLSKSTSVEAVAIPVENKHKVLEMARALNETLQVA